MLGGKLGSAESFAAWLALLRHEKVSFDVVWIAEVDGKLRRKGGVCIPGFRCWRKWGGRGCKPMAWLVRNEVAECVKWRRWTRRSGALYFDFGEQRRIWLQGIHGAHGQVFQNSLPGASQLLRCKAANAPAVVCGDFNCDLLPVMENDPWKAIEGRHRRHVTERLYMHGFQDAHGLSISEVSGIRGTPASTFAASASLVHITRIPAVGLAERLM